MKKPSTVISAVCAVAFVVLIILKPGLCTGGAAEGILLSGRVIIPSLFPFTACVLFIMKSGALDIFKFAAPFTKKVFRLSPELFSLMLLSFIGGYPIGAKLLNEAVKLRRISPENAGIMLNYCVNAGPAFVILAVGGGIIGSKAVGYILLAAHIVSSFILSLVFGRFIKGEEAKKEEQAYKSTADNFVTCVSEAASAVFSICAYVVFFSTIISYINFYSEKLPFIKYFSSLLEVTNAVSKTRNILIIAFLLGFSGFCIWCQIISVGERLKINYPIFAASRIAHGLLSVGITALLLKIFNIPLTVSAAVRFAPSYSTLSLSVSMLCMVIVLLITLYTKNRTGKILDDIV